MRPHLALTLLLALLAAAPASAAKRALFDNFHAEQAGNADWVIDDQQPTPSPAQAGITAATARTYWQGAISSWGVDLVKRGFTVTTNNAAFTYGNATNPLDLSNFDVLIVPEPNTSFTAAEKTAILAFVYDGGGLIAVGDHHISDRNSDGVDSPMIWNALDPTFLLGVHWGTAGDANNNIVQTSSNVNAAASDSVTRGPEGNVAQLAFHNGTTFTLHPEVNPTVRGEVWMTGVAQTSLTGVMAASSRYGSGRVFFLGDSSPVDDGSANPGNSSIFDGWGEVADSVLIMNATLWASRREPTAGDAIAPSVTLTSPNGGEDWKAGSTHAITWTASDNIGVTAIDLAWSSDGGVTWTNGIATGLASSGSYNWTVPDSPGGNRRVRAVARDAAANSTSDASNAGFTISRWTVTALAGAGGAVSPSGATGVAQGGSVVVGIAPASGFAIAAVQVDGVGAGTPSSYTFNAVAADHTLAATFADVAAPLLALGAPVGGEQWDIVSSHAITWSASDNAGVSAIDLEWSAHGAAGPWQSIATGVANSGSYAWLTPAVVTDSALVRVTARDAAGNVTVRTSPALFTLVNPSASAGPGAPVLALAPPAPNPAHGRATLRFTLPAEAAVTLELLDVRGRRVWSRHGTLGAGTHAWDWDGRDAEGRPSGAGLYLVRLGTPWGTRGARLVWTR